ncbi:hypothetical protein CERZMDRAFT_119520 [Cercospora zeae-maydis SCOH1-5]|uniref:Secreted protein n=1 Tax=Cercospora zeae-maydis SCOH1-5 TaxID=717836 RepID=A0A6A6FWS7_9PEZI|nr:hypothetical protein CERZMDRAFT_119520 [Cercospora zeae-maydis SCOH1-5]
MLEMATILIFPLFSLFFLSFFHTPNLTALASEPYWQSNNGVQNIPFWPRLRVTKYPHVPFALRCGVYRYDFCSSCFSNDLRNVATSSQ